MYGRQGEASGMIAIEHHLCATLASSLTEEDQNE